MRRASVVLCVLVVILACVVAAVPAACAADQPAAGGREGERRGGADGQRRGFGAQFGLVRQALEKRQRGEALTDEEKAAVERVDRFRQAMGDRAAGAAGDAGPGAAVNPFAGARGKPGLNSLVRLTRDPRLNVLDEAYFFIAEIHVKDKKYDKAVEAFQRLLDNSPDKLAISLAHLNMAELYRSELGNKTQAIAEYKKVTGDYAADAQKRLAALFEELDQIDEAVATFETLIRTTGDKLQKVLALQELADMLFRNGRGEEAVAALVMLTKAVNYEEAKEITKTLNEMEAERQKVAEQQRTQEFGNRMREFRDRFAAGIRQPGGDRPARPDAAEQPRRPTDNKAAQPEERPIRPDAP